MMKIMTNVLTNLRVGVVSDTRLPTHWGYPGHGLGKQNLIVSKILRKNGAKVTLFAAPGSADDADLVHCRSVEDLNKAVLETELDLIIDSSHQHVLYRMTDVPVLNYSHDRESYPGTKALVPSHAHAQYHGLTEYEVIPNCVDLSEFSMCSKPKNYYAFLASPHPKKGVKSAMYAAKIIGFEFVMAGNGTEGLPFGIGPLIGKEKVKFLQEAKALLFPSSQEAGPITVLEAQACGTPVLTYNKGGAAEYMIDGKTGFAAEDLDQFVDVCQQVDTINRYACRDFVKENHTIEHTEASLLHAIERFAKEL